MNTRTPLLRGERVNGQTEAEKEDGSKEVTERDDQFLNPFHMLGFGEHQSDKQCSDRFGDMDRFREAGNEKEGTEDDKRE